MEMFLLPEKEHCKKRKKGGKDSGGRESKRWVKAGKKTSYQDTMLCLEVTF